MVVAAGGASRTSWSRLRRLVLLPVASALPMDRIRVGGGVNSGGGEPWGACHWSPPPLYIGLRDRGPPAFYGLRVPDQDAVQGPSWPLGQLVEINLILTGFGYSRIGLQGILNKHKQFRITA